MQEKKVAFYLATMAYGGSEKVALNLLKGLSNKFNAIDLILFRCEGEFLAEVPDNVRIIELKAHREYQTIKPLREYLLAEKPDILIAHHGHLSALLTACLIKSNTKIVLIKHNMLDLEFSQSKFAGLRYLISKLLYKRARYIIAVSKSIADDLQDKYHLTLDKIVVIHNPLSYDVVSKIANDKVCKQNPKHPTILAVGRLAKEKNLSLLIEAFKYVNDKIPSAQLIILGEGAERLKLEQLVRKYHLEYHVQMPGFTSNPFSYMKNASVLALSSNTEGFPNAILESLACGCPIVSTDCGGVKEIISDRRYGLLVPIGDCSALAGALIEQISRKVDTSVLKAKAQEFSLDNISDKYIKLINSI